MCQSETKIYTRVILQLVEEVMKAQHNYLKIFIDATDKSSQIMYESQKAEMSCARACVCVCTDTHTNAKMLRLWSSGM
jgi:hypothetical protein